MALKADSVAQLNGGMVLEAQSTDSPAEIPKELCMKASFRYNPKIMRLFENLPPLFRIERSGEMVHVYLPVGYKADMEEYGFGVREFYEAYKAITVEGGRKVWKSGRIEFRPKADILVTVRLSESELELVKLAAQRAGQTLPHYIRGAALGRMLRELGL